MSQKNRIVLGIVLAVIVAIVWVYDSFYTDDYNWQSKTYHHEDKQPYGCKVFDRLMETSCSNGYAHSYQSLGALESEFNEKKTGFLMINPDDDFLDRDIDTLLRMTRRGAIFMLIANYFPDSLMRILQVKTKTYHRASWDSVALHFSAVPDKVYRVNRDAVFQLLDIDRNDSLPSLTRQPTPLVMADSGWVSLCCPYGKGAFILSTAPQLFTNVGIMRPSSQRFVLQQLGYIADRQIVRTEYYNSYYRTQLHYFSDGKAPTLFSVLMAHRGTRWAFILCLLIALLFLATNAVRRQQPIPIIRPPQNRILRFVSSIAGLYLHRNSNANILLKKRLYWADGLQRSTGINVADFERNPEICNTLAEKASQPATKVQALLKRLFSISENDVIGDEELMNLVNEMDEIA